MLLLLSSLHNCDRPALSKADNGLWLLLPHNVDDDDDELSVEDEEDVDIVGRRSLFAELGRIRLELMTVELMIFSLLTELGREMRRPERMLLLVAVAGDFASVRR